jgi:hypothetical protein
MKSDKRAYEAVKRALQDFLVPELRLISEQLSALVAKADALNAKLDAMIRSEAI